MGQVQRRHPQPLRQAGQRASAPAVQKKAASWSALTGVLESAQSPESLRLERPTAAQRLAHACTRPGAGASGV